MKRFMSAWLVFVLASVAHAVGVGDSESAVLRDLGRPNMTRKTSDGAVILRFKDGTVVRLKGGVVREITGPATAAVPETREETRPTRSSSPSSVNPPSRPPAKPAAVRTAPTPAAEPNRISNSPTAPRAQNKTQGSSGITMRHVGLLCMAIGAIVAFACNIMLLVVAFRVSFIWLLLCIFVPFASLVFIIMHWSETKKLMVWQFLVALPFIVLGIALTPN